MQIPPRCNFASASFSAIPGKLEVGPKLRPACSGACLSAWFRIGRAPTAGSRGYLGAKRPHWATRLAETSAKAKNSAGWANAWLGNQARGPPRLATYLWNEACWYYGKEHRNSIVVQRICWCDMKVLQVLGPFHLKDNHVLVWLII